MKSKHKIILWIIGLSCLLVFYYIFDPTYNRWALKCPFWMITGYYCPGCGSQRAIHSLLNGNIIEGIRYNYLLVPSLAYVILLTIAPNQGRMVNLLTSETACWIIFAVIMGWWLFRNIIEV